jgi:phage FluMu gp28-like protein
MLFALTVADAARKGLAEDVCYCDASLTTGELRKDVR